MRLFSRRNLSLFVAALLGVAPLSAQIPLAPGVRVAHPDHHEFEAALWAPFLGEAGEARTFTVGFGYVDAQTGTVGSWRLELVDAKGRARRAWHGETFLAGGFGTQRIAWNGLDEGGAALEPGFYTLRLTAKPMAQEAYRHYPGGSQQDRVEAHLGSSPEEAATQETTVRVGPAPRLKVRGLDLPTGSLGRRPAAAPGSAPAPASLPYTVYLGNLHSQTNHSDGGVPPASCSGSENPQAGVDGPTTAFEMMRVDAGGDFLAATEHNHMYDGSTGTNTGGDPAVSNALFNSGLAEASAHRTAHPGFVASYGVEWGVISNGGHLNIFNPDLLPTWEYNGASQLLGGIFTAKSDYPALYLVMQARGWVGQFNHPQVSQFNNRAYTAAGDEVMVLCEVSNSAAFSKNTHEGGAPDTDTFLSNFEVAFNAILERGFHVAPTSNQDNHCSNWGLSQRNRTGILVPNGTPWTLTAMLDAIRARRTFATQDKGSQIALTSSAGALMGERINNSGSLTLQVHYAPSAGRSASRIQIFEGVPGTAFSTVQMIEGTDTATITPAAGSHYYYAKITQDDGRFLWTAPLWVNQAAGAVSANITQPATNTTVLDGANVSFTGTATTINTAITGHSWNFGDGSPVVTGTATPSHTFNNAGAVPVVYTVTYTATDNTAATGQASRLITVQPAGAVNTNPTISDIPNQSTLKDTPIANLGFTIGDAETNANLLTVAATSNNQALLPDANILLGGSGTARNVSLTPAPDQTGTATVTVTVFDGAGGTAVDTFNLVVTAPGSATSRLIISQYYEGAGNDKVIEITNVGGSTYNSATTPLYLGLWSNPATGGTTYSSLLIPGTIAPSATITIRNTSGSYTGVNFTGTPVNTTTSTSFNGDDISYITPISSANAAAYAARTDVIGDNVSSWTTVPSGGAGKDTSYYRKPTVAAPNAAFTTAEWTQVTLATANGASTGTAQRLGEHIFNSLASISDIPSQTIPANASTGAIAFTVGGTGTLSVAATTSNATLIPVSSIVFDVVSGTATSRTVTLTPVADQVGTAVITVTVIDGNGATASDSLQLSVTDPASTITSVVVSPAAPTVNGLTSTPFSATVSGTGSYTSAVTWSANGGSITAGGVWTAPNSGGPYTLTATSVQDPTKSGTATVTVLPVNTNPTISDITDKSTAMNVALVAIPFTVGDAETPAASLGVSAASTNTTLIPNANLTFGGSGASRTLTVTPAAGQTGSATITVTVTDANGGTASDTFVVNVVPALIISQYYEGASFDKWIEITNVGASALTLNAPQLYLVLFSNAAADNPGSSSPTGSLALTGTLAPGASAVFKHSSAVNPTYATGTGNSAVINFNGDDLVILSTSNSGTAGTAWNARLDVVGDGTSWGVDTSFHRIPTVLAGNPAFNLAGEWIQRTNAQVNAAVSDALSEHIGIHLFGAIPTISDMADLTVTVNTAIPGIPFTVTDAETNPDSLAFTLTSSNTALLPNAGITVSGSGPGKTLNLAPAAGQLGTATVTVLIRDGGNQVASDTFVLTVNDVPPSALAYSANPAVYTKGVAIASNTPSNSGGAITGYAVAPALPAGLALNPATGVISGTPTAITATATYTVTGTNSGGSTSVGVVITVNDVPPSALAYSLNPALYPTGLAIAPNTPSSAGGPITGYTVAPALPAGLSLNPTSGVITGTPTAAAPTATYVVTGSNTGGSTTANLVLTTVVPAIAAWTGAGQTLTVGATAAPLQARVTYGGSVPLPGIPVVFTAPASGPGGTFASAAAVLTDANGVATAPAFTANCTPGAYSLTAAIPGGGPSAGFGMTNVVGAVAGLSAYGFPSPLKAGTAATITVSARDLCGNVNPAYRGTVRFTSTDPAAVLPPDYTFGIWDNGIHTFTVTLRTPGTWSIQAQDTANGALLGIQTGIVASAVPVTSILAFSPATGPVGTMVTLTGTGFAGASSVQFNGVPASYTVLGGLRIIAFVPAGAATGKITVVSPTGTATTTRDFTVTP